MAGRHTSADLTPNPTTPMRTLAVVTLLLSAAAARAELVALDLHTREPFANGKSFGDVGPYEKLVGVARFAVDPDHARNKGIVDLSLAPKDKEGKVEFRADVFILCPKDPGKGNGAILYDVNNRGNKLALGMFNSGGGGNDPGEGNGFLFRRGYTVVWCGWIGELLPGDGRLLLEPPVARDKDRPITGTVRYEMSSDKAVKSMPLSRRPGHGSYPPTKKGEAEGVLTWRAREGDERVVIPREQWSIERKEVVPVEKGVKGTLGEVRLTVSGGFRPGYLYELVCEAEGPIVQGTGFAAVRDLISFLKHDTGKNNPLLAGKKSAIDRAHAFGVSQSGRFLRHLLYQGFNVDEKGRRVFDGLMPHVAGGGLGYFNHRFAQPTRHNGQHEDHLYPCDVFPFTYGEGADEYFEQRNAFQPYGPGVVKRGALDGILKRTLDEDAKLAPKVMHTQSAAEYWHRSGSLVHTDTLGKKDATIPDNVRIYAFGGTQHGPAAPPLKLGNADNLPNPGNYRPLLRALLGALDAWVKDGTTPPASVYPRIDKGTLVDWKQKATGFPSLPGVRYPEVIQQPFALDLGKDFATKGLLPQEPPRILGKYAVLVPRSGKDGNDLGCLLPVEVAVPLATYTGWNLRNKDVGAEGMLYSLLGSYLPFAATEKERKERGDPRESIQKRYGDYEGYRKKFQAESDRLVKDRYLLKEDAEAQAKEVEKARKEFPGEK